MFDPAVAVQCCASSVDFDKFIDSSLHQYDPLALWQVPLLVLDQTHV